MISDIMRNPTTLKNKGTEEPLSISTLGIPKLGSSTVADFCLIGCTSIYGGTV